MNYAFGPAAAAAIREQARAEFEQARAELAGALAFAVAREQAAAAEQRLEMKALLEDMRAQRDFWKWTAETKPLPASPRSWWQWGSSQPVTARA
jgi:siroheme synthase (precorrin-2 oxidase/ferrochelatase)